MLKNHVIIHSIWMQYPSKIFFVHLLLESSHEDIFSHIFRFPVDIHKHKANKVKSHTLCYLKVSYENYEMTAIIKLWDRKVVRRILKLREITKILNILWNLKVGLDKCRLLYRPTFVTGNIVELTWTLFPETAKVAKYCIFYVHLEEKLVTPWKILNTKIYFWILYCGILKIWLFITALAYFSWNSLGEFLDY